MQVRGDRDNIVKSQDLNLKLRFCNKKKIGLSLTTVVKVLLICTNCGEIKTVFLRELSQHQSIRVTSVK